MTEKQRLIDIAGQRRNDTIGHPTTEEIVERAGELGHQSARDTHSEMNLPPHPDTRRLDALLEWEADGGSRFLHQYGDGSWTVREGPAEHYYRDITPRLPTAREAIDAALEAPDAT